jgi:radical SAM superfamily enzyme YgiQ (UPF0313 family)
MWTTRYVARDPVRVVDEIERYVKHYRAEAIDFYDLTAIVKRDWVLRFCRELRARRLDITWQLPSGTRSEALDGEVLRAMYEAGCRNVSYAPESGSARTLRRIRKKVRLDRMLDSMREAVDIGLNVKANIILGFPGETIGDAFETLGFLVKMARAGVHDASVWAFSPYPGCVLYDELVSAGRIGPMDDDYFASLLAYSDLSFEISYDEHLPARFLRALRFAGTLGFYGSNYLLHPSRPVRSIFNVATSRYESRMEMSLGNLGRRLRNSGRVDAGSSHRERMSA